MRLIAIGILIGTGFWHSYAKAAGTLGAVVATKSQL